MAVAERLARYAVAGQAAATAAVVNDCIGALWNPHATKSISVISVARSRSVGGALGVYAQRITTKGTPGSTITPDIDNDLDRLLAPISGAVLDLGPYSVQPTPQTPNLFRFPTTQVSAVNGIAELWFGENGIEIPHGTGLGVFQGNATATTEALSFVWDE
jgi:hypothetical protein